MIVRILGSGQWEVAGGDLREIEELDGVLTGAVDGGDASAFDAALENLISAVERVGTPVPEQDTPVSDLVIPGRGYTLEEVSNMLQEEV